MEIALRLEINFFCLVVLVVLGLGIERRKSERQGPELRVFGGMLLSTAAMLVLDAFTWIFDGMPGEAGRTAVLVSNTLYYMIHFVPMTLFLIYVDFQIFRDAARVGRLLAPAFALVGFMGVAAIASAFTGLLFIVDASNRYLRGPAFPAFAFLSYVLMIFSIVVVLANRRNLGRRVFWSLLAYPIPSMLGSFAQMLFYGLVLVWPATTIFLLMASINIQHRRASTDHLTGAGNRRSLDEELERRIKVGGAIGGILVDLDDFKSINDSLGHEAGDRALEDAATLLRRAVRAADFVARYGGDEFVILLAGDAAIDDVATRLRELVASHNACAGRSYGLSFSIGSALFDPAADPGPSAFLARLDAAMYADKAVRKREPFPA